MSFTKINPPGWSLGDKLTSAQVNALDADHVNALDKSVAGDTLMGVVQTGITGRIVSSQPLGIRATTAQAIDAAIAYAIQSSVVGAIALGGGTSDEIQYVQSRTKVVAMAMQALSDLGAGWAATTNGGQGLLGPGSGTPQGVGPLLVHHGATLTDIAVLITPVNSHVSLPAVMPEVQVYRYDLTTATLLQIADVSAAAGTAAAWNATTVFHVPVTSNNVIDRTKYVYFIRLFDESGSGSLVGNSYNGMLLTYANIPNMQFA